MQLLNKDFAMKQGNRGFQLQHVQARIGKQFL